MEHNLTKKKMNNKRELNAIPVTIEDGKQNRDFDLRSYQVQQKAMISNIIWKILKFSNIYLATVKYFKTNTGFCLNVIFEKDIKLNDLSIGNVAPIVKVLY